MVCFFLVAKIAGLLFRNGIGGQKLSTEVKKMKECGVATTLIQHLLVDKKPEKTSTFFGNIIEYYYNVVV
jgi:hypothetical protein